MVDAHKNFAYSTIATAPSPAASGTSLVVAAGEGVLFPAVPFNASVWPSGVQPLASNAEIVRVTSITTDTFTITRTQEGFGPRTIIVGDQIAATITVKTLTDVEAHEADTSAAHAASAISNVPAGTVAATTIQVAIDELAADYASADSTHAGGADPHTVYRLKSVDHTHASTGLQAGALYVQRSFLWTPDAAPATTIVAGDQQGHIAHSGPGGLTAVTLYVDAETAPGASGLPITVQYGDTNDLDTVASWTTIATYTLSSEKSNKQTSMTNATVPADRLMRMNVGTIVGTPNDATITLEGKTLLTT